jgi:hypothetical protein
MPVGIGLPGQVAKLVVSIKHGGRDPGVPGPV